MTHEQETVIKHVDKIINGNWRAAWFRGTTCVHQSFHATQEAAIKAVYDPNNNDFEL